jgi:hypothetical protein
MMRVANADADVGADADGTREGKSDDTGNDSDAIIICQRWVKKGVLRQRIRTRDGCIDQTINAATGAVAVSQVPSCDPSCR